MVDVTVLSSIEIINNIKVIKNVLSKVLIFGLLLDLLHEDNSYARAFND